MGAADRAGWGEDDHELSLSLTPAATAALAIALLREQFGGRPDALEAIRAWCDDRGIDTRYAAWT